jgi:hypothetical protein
MPIKYIINADGEFVCEFCGFTASPKNQSTMHYHMKKHQEEHKYKCEHCNYSCVQKCTMAAHVRAKHASDKDRKMICCPHEGCKFKSLTKSNCRTHFLRQHCKELVDQVLEEKTHCSACQKTFASSPAFYYHVVGCIAFDEGDVRIKELQSIL